MTEPRMAKDNIRELSRIKSSNQNIDNLRACLPIKVSFTQDLKSPQKPGFWRWYHKPPDSCLCFLVLRTQYQVVRKQIEVDVGLRIRLALPAGMITNGRLWLHHQKQIKPFCGCSSPFIIYFSCFDRFRESWVDGWVCPSFEGFELLPTSWQNTENSRSFTHGPRSKDSLKTRPRELLQATALTLASSDTPSVSTNQPRCRSCRQPPGSKINKLIQVWWAAGSIATLGYAPSRWVVCDSWVFRSQKPYLIGGLLKYAGDH